MTRTTGYTGVRKFRCPGQTSREMDGRWVSNGSAEFLPDGVAIADAKPDNFILSHEGVVPIDLQMAHLEPSEESIPSQQAGKPKKTTDH